MNACQYRVDEQTKTIYEYDEEANSYFFYTNFSSLTKQELKEIRNIEKTYWEGN